MTSELKPCNWCGISEQSCEDEACPQQARTVPDVPEMVRWKHCEYPNQHKIMEHKDGEYVIHSQAIEIIAADRAEIKRLRSLNHYAHLEAVAIRRAKAAESKLAQYEAQVPIAWVDENGMAAFTLGGISTVHTQFESHRSDRFKHPLYAAPISDSLRDETIEMCRKAVRNAILHMNPEDRFIGDLCDDAIAIALVTLNVEASNDKE